MSQLVRLGFFHELQGDQAAAVLSALRQERPDAEEHELVGYLRQGRPFAHCMQTEVDPLTSPPTALGAVVLLTDGRWAWPESLPYFVRTYHLRLPAEFIDHARANSWICPTPDSQDMMLEGHQVM